MKIIYGTTNNGKVNQVKEFFEATGAVKAWDYFWGNGTDRDYTHTNDIGGNIVARFEYQGSNFLPWSYVCRI